MANAIAFGLLCVVLIIAAVTDIRTRNIYDWLTIPAILFGLLLWSVVGLLQTGSRGAFDGLTQASIGLIAGLIPSLIILHYGGINAGDVKLVTAIGAVSGSAQCVLGAALYGMPIVMLMAIAVMIRQGLVVRTLRRVGGVFATVFSRKKSELPSDSPRIPVAAGLCVGGIIAGAEHLLRLRLILG